MKKKMPESDIERMEHDEQRRRNAIVPRRPDNYWFPHLMEREENNYMENENED